MNSESEELQEIPLWKYIATALVIIPVLLRARFTYTRNWIAEVFCYSFFYGSCWFLRCTFFYHFAGCFAFRFNALHHLTNDTLDSIQLNSWVPILLFLRRRSFYSSLSRIQTCKAFLYHKVKYFFFLISCNQHQHSDKLKSSVPVNSLRDSTHLTVYARGAVV